MDGHLLPMLMIGSSKAVAVAVLAVEGVRNLVGGDGRGVDALGLFAELDPPVGVAAAAVPAEGRSRRTAAASATATTRTTTTIAAHFPNRCTGNATVHRRRQ